MSFSDLSPENLDGGITGPLIGGKVSTVDERMITLIEKIENLTEVVRSLTQKQTILHDGYGGDNKSCIDESGSLCVIDRGIPPKSLDTPVKIYREFFKNSSDSIDMRVDGSTTPVEFTIGGTNGADRYIETISFLIVDVNATLSKFGNLTALTNGCDILYQDAKLGDVIIASGLKTNFDFVRLCTQSPAFGDGATAYRASNIVGSAEGYFPSLDLSDTFGIPWGLKLPSSGIQKIIIRINDDVRGIDAFDAVVYGYDRIL